MWIKAYVLLVLASGLACGTLAGCEGEDDDDACGGQIDDDGAEGYDDESGPDAEPQGAAHGDHDDDGGHHDDDGHDDEDCGGVVHQKAVPSVEDPRGSR